MPDQTELIQEILPEVLFKITTTGAWSKRNITIVTSIDRLQRYQVSENTTALDRLPLGQDYEPKDFEVLDEFLKSTDDLPEPTQEFESQAYPPPDDFEEHPDTKEEPDRPPSPAIPQPRISPRKIRHNWTPARGKFSPGSEISSDDDDDMGSNNEEDPKDPDYFPPDSSMDSGCLLYTSPSPRDS